jgi:Enoyl-(Acyl carrier protein) reductase
MPGLDLETTTLEDWRAHHAANADGAFLGCKHGILSMRGNEGWGAIVNIATAVAVRVHAGSPACAASKASAIALTRIAALHCGEKRYRSLVNSVLPGPIDTAMIRSNVASDDEMQRLVAPLSAKYPIGRVDQPADVANAVLFLCSDRASFVTDATVPGPADVGCEPAARALSLGGGLFLTTQLPEQRSRSARRACDRGAAVGFQEPGAESAGLAGECDASCSRRASQSVASAVARRPSSSSAAKMCQA